MLTLPSWLPAELGTVVLGMTPLIELQGAIPFGYAAGLPLSLAFLFGELGNIVPILAIYALGARWIAWTEKNQGFLHKITHWVVERSRHKAHGKFERAHLLALTVFVALPFPGAGTITGSLAAFLFGIPFREAFPYVLAGNILNGVAVSLAVSGSVALAKFFL